MYGNASYLSTVNARSGSSTGGIPFPLQCGGVEAALAFDLSVTVRVNRIGAPRALISFGFSGDPSSIASMALSSSKSGPTSAGGFLLELLLSPLCFADNQHIDSGEERERDLENMKIERRKHGNEPLRVWHTRNPQKESLEKVEIEAM